MTDLVPWGYGGIQLAQEHQMNDQLMRGREVGIQQAQQNLEASAQEQQINQQAASMFQTLAKGGTIPGASANPNDTAGSPAEAFDKVGSTMLNIGQPNKAMEYFKAAGTLRQSQNDAAKALTDQQEAKYNLLNQQADIIGRDLGGATNADEWDQGIQSLQQQAAAGVIPQALVDQVKNLPFTPKVAAHFRDSALSVKDKASLDMQGQRAQMAEDAKIATANYRQQRLQLDQQKIDDARTAKEKSEKTGKLASAPTTAQIKEAEGIVSSVILGDNTPVKPKTGDRSLSYQAYQAGVVSIANRAQDMLKENPGLSRDEALNRAALESKAAGDWDVVTESHKILGVPYKSADTEVTYQGAGKQPEEALPIPMTDDNKPDMSNLKAGRWYDNGGKKGKYLGDGKWEVIQ